MDSGRAPKASHSSGDEHVVQAKQSLELAEKKVLAKESCDEAVMIATEAMTVFTSAGHLDGIAQAFYIVIEAELIQALHRGLVQVGGYRLFQRSMQMLQSRVRKELRRFDDEEHIRGQGMLQLLLAQLFVAQRHEAKRDMALEAVDNAVDLLSQVDDRKYLPRAYQVRAELALKVGDRSTAAVAVDAALAKVASHDRCNKARAWHLQGLCYKMADTLESLRSAADAMGKAVDIYRELALPLQVAEELAAQAEVYYIMENDDAALDAASQAQNSMPLSTPSPSYGTVVTIIVQLLLDNGEIDAAADVAAQHVQAAQQSADVHRELTATALLVLANLRRGRQQEALRKAQAGLELALVLEDPAYEAKARLSLAQVCLEMAKAEDAREYSEAAVDTLQKSNAPILDMAAAQKQAAVVLLASGHHNDAFGHASVARENYGEVGDELGKCEALLVFAECMAAQGRVEVAIETCTDALEQLKAAGSTRLHASALAYLSVLCESVGNLERAVELTREQRHLLNIAGFRKLEAQSLERLAHLFFAMENYDMCVQVAREGNSLAKAKKNTPLQVSLLMLIVDAALAKPMPPKLRSDSAYRKWKEQIISDAQSAINLCVDKPCQRRTDSSTFALKAEATFVCAKALLAFEGPQMADDIAKEALEYFNQANHKRGAGLCNLMLADSYREAGMIPLALAHARDALRALQEVDDETQVERTKEILAACGAPAPKQQPVEAEAEEPEESTTAEPMLPADLQELQTTLMHHFMECVEEGVALALDTPFIDAGMDSLSMTAFRASLKEAFQKEIPPELMFDHPHAAALSKAIFDIMQG